MVLAVWFAAPALAQSATVTVVVAGEPSTAAPEPEPEPEVAPVPVELADEAPIRTAGGPVVVQGWDTGAEAATAGRVALALGGGLALIALRPRRALRWMLA